MTDSEKEGEGCSCDQELWKYLPPELRPKEKKPSTLHKVTCRGCGRVFWTNKETEYCFDCERQNRE